MDRKRIQCLSNASQHVHIYLQPFICYSEILVGNCNFFLPPLHLMPPYGVAPETIAVNVTWIEREFNACQTPRSMYPSIFNHFWDIAIYRWRVTGFWQFSWANEHCFYHILLSPGYAPGTIAVLHGSKENSMPVKRLAACTHLSLTVSEI